MDATPVTSTQRLAAEALGTLILVLVTVSTGGGAVAAGFVLVALTYGFGRLSGGHFNPAVTVGSALAGRTAWKDGFGYLGAQFAGAIVAGIVLVVLSFGDEGYEFFDSSVGANAFGDEGTGYAFWAALLLTLIATAFFVILYLALSDKRSEHATFAPLAVGLAYAAALGATADVGGTVNPAQSLGTALFSGTDLLLQVWVFLLGPLLGAIAGGFAYPALFGADREKVPGSGLDFGGPKQPQQNFGPGGYQQQWNQPGGYQQPGQPGQAQPGGYAAPAAQSAAPQPAAEQPIIQDGWQWDPQAQQWIPAQQQAPQQGSWQAPPSGEQTQVRPQDGV